MSHPLAPSRLEIDGPQAAVDVLEVVARILGRAMAGDEDAVVCIERMRLAASEYMAQFIPE